MPAPTLVSSCTKACIKNVRSLVDVGDFEYWKIESILKRVDSPQQLHEIETRSPQIKGEDSEIWLSFIRRDIPNWKDKNYVPKNPTKWYEVYCRYKKELAKELEKDQEELKARMAELNKKKSTHVSKIVDLRKLPKVPRDPRMMANNGGVPIGRNKENGVIKHGASSLTWTTGSKTKMTDGKSVMTRARREAKEISQRGRLARPTHQLGGRVGQVRQAPAGMVNEYRRDRLPALAPVKILSKKRDVSDQVGGSIGGPSLEERERRLRALTMTRGQAFGAAEPTLVSSEDDDDDDLEDLFDEKPKQIRGPSTNSSKSMLSPPSSSPSTKSQPRQLLKSTPLSSSASPAPRIKPSDVISAMISIPKSKPAARTSMPMHSKTPTTFSRSPSPSHGDRNRMMIKKRPAPDVFNRAASKKPRAR
ncbi:hypothetical protein D0Z07_2311 [Hyphodiscus hymeniophilus]|uniref:Elongin-A n=1 Tax=Hyphodiscus hymeniophilus TaxID=353542 RepID=A0A9P6VNC3_9HELO|nr:hypothetical protein D0Z07_2311 [Hyphodiscus hymeniophilus]